MRAHALSMHQNTIRLTDELHAWLEEDAKAHGRTVAQSIRWYLERARQPKPDHPQPSSTRPVAITEPDEFAVEAAEAYRAWQERGKAS